jgi:hypothetical protein
MIPVQTSRHTPAGLLGRVADYVQAQAGRVQDATFDIGSRELVETALGFHALQNTLRVEWDPIRRLDPRPLGLAIVWRDRLADVQRRDAAGECAWQWQPDDPEGDCLYLALVITTAPGVLERLGAWFDGRFPPLPQYAYRRGRLVRCPVVQRLARRVRRKETV